MRYEYLARPWIFFRFFFSLQRFQSISVVVTLGNNPGIHCGMSPGNPPMISQTICSEILKGITLCIPLEISMWLHQASAAENALINPLEIPPVISSKNSSFVFFFGNCVREIQQRFPRKLFAYSTGIPPKIPPVSSWESFQGFLQDSFQDFFFR